MIDGLDLERGMRDPVSLGETCPRRVQHAMVVGASVSDEVCGGVLHVRREGPHVEIVHVDHAVDLDEIGRERVEIDRFGCRLDQDPDR